MKSASLDIINLLNSGNDFQHADIWTFTLSGGQVKRYSGADIELLVEGNLFELGPIFSRNTIEERRGLEVSTLEVEISGKDTDLINGVPIIQFISRGGFNGALVKLERAFYTDWNTPAVGKIGRFSGKVTSIERVGGITASITVSSWSILLNVAMPASLYQTGCIHTVYDSGCTLSENSFKYSGSCASGGSVLSFNTNLTATNNIFSQGRIVFKSGVNNGLSRSIKSNVGGFFNLVSPLPSAPSLGDTFDAYWGCDLTYGTCLNKFNNLPNFKGTPFVPIPETAI